MALKVWALWWEDRTIENKCDNMAVVGVQNTGCARDAILATCAATIGFLLLYTILNCQSYPWCIECCG